MHWRMKSRKIGTEPESEDMAISRHKPRNYLRFYVNVSK